MRLDAARADRHHAVRAAAIGWKRAGVIDEPTYRAIAAAYPDDRVRLGLGLRILAGLAAFVAGGALAGLLVLIVPAGEAFFAIGLTVLFTAATEFQTGRLRRAQAGAEYATALIAAVSASVAWMWFRYAFVSESVWIWIGSSLAFALAAWRWGYASFAVLAGLFFLLACGSDELGRLLWLALGVAALPMIVRLARSPRWPPAHRRCFAACGLVLLAGAYVASNVYALDHRWIGWLSEGPHIPANAAARLAAILGTIFVPPAVVALGLRYRHRMLLTAGVVFTAASLVTLQRYCHLGPSWLWWIVGGAGCIGLAVVVRRWLDTGPERERWGFTAERSFEDRRVYEAAETAATLAAMSPGPRVESDPPFTGGGGSSGGGGATGTNRPG